MNTPRSASPHRLVALAIAGVVLCPLLGPVVIVLAERARKQAVLDDQMPPPMLMVARILGYVGTAVLCLDLLVLIVGAAYLALSSGAEPALLTTPI